MQLEFICDMNLSYQEEPLSGEKFLLVRPFGGEEGAGFGEGDGTVSGPRIKGKIRWVTGVSSKARILEMGIIRS